MTFDRGHGTQVEYIGPGGTSYLWYPGNKIILPGKWQQQAGSSKQRSQICFKYGPNSYNPVTHVYGDKWECEDMSLYTSVVVEQARGDVFGLAHRSAAPFQLPPNRVSMQQLADKIGPSASLGAVEKSAPVSSAPAPVTTAEAVSTCAAIVAKATSSRSAMISAALTYYHGEYMGKSCVAVDYGRAFALLKQAGDVADYNTLVGDLRTRASSGNPKAVAALDKLGLSN